MKNIKITALIAFSAFFITSCSNSDLTDLNHDNKAFTKPLPEGLMSFAQKEYAYFLANRSVAQNNFRMYAQQSCETEYTQEANYNMSSRGISDSNYNNLYTKVLKNLKDAQQRISEEKTYTAKELAIKNNKLAILEIQIVNTYQSLVDIFGNMPYSQSLDINNLTPVYDDAQTIYLDIAKRLDNAIANLDTNNVSFGNADLIYGGNVSHWKKYAYSIKLKLGMHLADVNSALSKQMVESAYTSGLFTSNDDNAVFNYLEADPNGNPFYLSDNPHINPTEFLVNTLVNLNDPRADKYLDPDTKIDGAYKGAIYGSKSDYYDLSALSQTFFVRNIPCLFFDYSETNFLLADAANRGYNVGDDAATYYEKGIRASMQFWGVASDDIDTYLLQPSVAFTTATGTPKERIANQLWIAYFNRGFEAWTEYRRLDFPNLQAPPTAVAAAKGKVPVRLIYSHLDTSQNNVNYVAASAAIGGDYMTTKLFWDKN